VNRLDGDDKEYGYIVDYKDLFKSLEGAVHDYTSGALDGYDKEDVAGLLENRLVKARERLEETRESVKALCEPVEVPRDSAAYLRYFCAKDSGNIEQLKANEPNRLALYTHVVAFVRAFANIANELPEAGYSPTEINALKVEVDHYEKVRNEVKLASGDYIDLKMYEPAMRHLIDTYIRAEESEKVSAFDDISLIQLIVERGAAAIDSLPDGIKKNKEAVAEAIENNVRRLIIDEQPINPKYYEKMSELLDALIEQRRKEALGYKEYLQRIVELTRKISSPEASGTYPPIMRTPGKRALYDNLDKDERLALAVDAAVRDSRQDDWRSNSFKIKRVRNAVRAALELAGTQGAGGVRDKWAASFKESMESLEERVERILVLVKNQNEY
jgi:type I restriction enzyme R subunit